MEAGLWLFIRLEVWIMPKLNYTMLYTMYADYKPHKEIALATGYDEGSIKNIVSSKKGLNEQDPELITRVFERYNNTSYKLPMVYKTMIISLARQYTSHQIRDLLGSLFNIKLTDRRVRQIVNKKQNMQ